MTHGFNFCHGEIGIVIALKRWIRPEHLDASGSRQAMPVRNALPPPGIIPP
ncbi:MAG: hypothetical protein WAK18_15125 [Nocardioidaceae bacterium]